MNMFNMLIPVLNTISFIVCLFFIVNALRICKQFLL